LRDYDDYFWLNKDGTGKLGFTSYKKCTKLRMLAYGVAHDLVDEYTCMSESTCLESVYKICKAQVQVFAGEYLRGPNVADTVRCQSMSLENFLVCLEA
jgi:hypothetical protein